MALPGELESEIVRLWNESTINDQFKSYWNAPVPGDFAVLNDGDAAPSQPFPYCVFNEESDMIVGKMSGRDNDSVGRFETRDIRFSFRIFTRQLVGINKSSKTLASELAIEVIKIYGGHPTVLPATLSLTHGSVLQVTLENDWHARVDERNSLWFLSYLFRLDSPVSS